MKTIKITEDQRQLIKELYTKYNKGERIKSQVLTDLYNRVTGKNLTNTTCGSCLRQRLFELVGLIDKARQNYRKNLNDEDIKFIKWASNLEEGIYPDFDKVVDIYNKAFNVDNKYTNCLPCIQKMFAELKNLL